MSNLLLVKQILSNKLSDEELIQCLDIRNVSVIQHSILQIVDREIKQESVKERLLEYCDYLDPQFKILGLCRIGHLAVYALKKLEYFDEYVVKYSSLSNDDKEQVDMLEKALCVEK